MLSHAKGMAHRRKSLFEPGRAEIFFSDLFLKFPSRKMLTSKKKKGRQLFRLQKQGISYPCIHYYSPLKAGRAEPYSGPPAHVFRLKNTQKRCFYRVKGTFLPTFTSLFFFCPFFRPPPRP